MSDTASSPTCPSSGSMERGSSRLSPTARHASALDAIEGNTSDLELITDFIHTRHA